MFQLIFFPNFYTTFLYHFFGNVFIIIIHVSCIFSQDHIEHSTIILKHMKFLFMFTSPFLFMCNFLSLPLKVNSSHMYSLSTYFYILRLTWKKNNCYKPAAITVQSPAKFPNTWFVRLIFNENDSNVHESRSSSFDLNFF